ncbi:MAG: VanZ family protein [Gammaproteobacteria bacterium]
MTQSKLQMPRLWFTLAYALVLGVGVLSLIPGPDIGSSDKFVHFLTYAVLSAGFSLIVEHRKSLWLVLFGLIAYGFLLEFLQGLTSYRFKDMADALANSLGVITGLVFYFTPFHGIFRRLERWLMFRW